MGWKVSSGRHSTLCPLKGWSCEAEPSGSKALPAAGRGVDPFLHASRCASCLWELPEGLGMRCWFLATPDAPWTMDALQCRSCGAWHRGLETGINPDLRHQADLRQLQEVDMQQQASAEAEGPHSCGLPLGRWCLSGLELVLDFLASWCSLT